MVGQPAVLVTLDSDLLDPAQPLLFADDLAAVRGDGVFETLKVTEAGAFAVVLEAIDPLAATGRVRIEREEWRADSIDGRPIAKDATVKVVSVSGTRVLVREHLQA